VVLVAAVLVAPAPALATPARVAPLAWTVGTPLVDGSGGVSAVSCATSNFCVAVDRSGAQSTFNGSSWSVPAVIDSGTALNAVSCPSATFCVATDVIGRYVVMNNAVWSAPTPFASATGPVMEAVSCASSSFCLAVGTTANFTPVDYYYVNGTWSLDSQAFDPTVTSPLNAVSCPTTTACWATTLSGLAFSFTLTAGPSATLVHSSTPSAIDPANPHFSAATIACTASTSCVVGSSTNQIATLTGTTWTTATVFPSNASGVQVACTPLACVANDSFSQGVSAPAPFTAWSSGGQLAMLSQITGLSCFLTGTVSACLAVDNDGFAISLTFSATGVPLYAAAASAFDPPHVLTSASCAAVDVCVAADAAGRTRWYRGGHWSAPTTISTLPLGVREVRCGPSAHPTIDLQCAAVIGDFHAYHLGSPGGTWAAVGSATVPTYAVSCASTCEYLSPAGRSMGRVKGYLPRLSPTAIATDVACPASASGCVAIDSTGHSYVSGSGGWSAGPRVESVVGTVLWSVACVSLSFCVAIDLGGHAYTFNGVTWSRGVPVSSRGLASVSCGATYFCVASDLVGGAYVYNGESWSPTTNVAGLSALRAVTCPSASVCLGVDGTSAYWLRVPTLNTHVRVVAVPAAQRRVGHTISVVEVSATRAPRGVVELRLGAGATTRCSATLRRISATTSRASCVIATTRAGVATLSAIFEGSFGFAASGPVVQAVNVTAR